MNVKRMHVGLEAAWYQTRRVRRRRWLAPAPLGWMISFTVPQRCRVYFEESKGNTRHRRSRRLRWARRAWLDAVRDVGLIWPAGL